MDNQENIVNLNEETQAAEVEVKPYTLRRLKDKDLWPVLDIIATVFPDDMASIFVKMAAGEKSLREAGAVTVSKLVIAICKNVGKIHEDLYAFLSDVSGIPADEIPEMEFGTTPAMLWDIIRNERNAGFFKVLSKLS